MLSFGFTRKKLMSLSPENRHRRIIKWLSGFYQTAACNRASFKDLQWLNRQYNMVLGWLDLPQVQIRSSQNPRRVLEQISDRIHTHRLAARMCVRDPDLLEKPVTRDSKMPAVKIDMDCHIALDGLRSTFNVGSVFRICEATGFSSIILGNTPGKEHSSVRKTAMGTHDLVHQEKTDDLYDTLLKKKEAGYRIIGVETMASAVAYDKMAWTRKTILVFGNEEYGIASHTLGACEAFIFLPMAGIKNSVNVANAAGVVCFEVFRTLSAAGG